MRRPSRLGRQRGAALLLAMVILTLVSTLAAGMIWQQWRAVEVETAERARSQSAWILTGALDWARLIVGEDRGSSDHLGEPWAVPLAEARLSTFLAADRNVTEEAGIDAFLSGSIEDAQARYNLRNLVVDNKIVEHELRILARLCERAGVAQDVATRIAEGLQGAWSPTISETAPIAPTTVAQLALLGLDDATVERLKPWLVLLPRTAKINLNTASAEVMAAAIEGIDLGAAQRLVEQRSRSPFKTIEDPMPYLPSSVKLQDLNKVAAVNTSFFIVHGRLRLGDHALEETSLLEKRGPRRVVALQRERVNVVAGVR
jgi:general secretion pathway protein K